MPINQNRFSSAAKHFKVETLWLSAMGFLVLGIALFATAAGAASGSVDANARYNAERAVCTSGQSSQDRTTCLREAGAARQESKVGRLNDDPTTHKPNALLRCNALPADDRDACQRRINGEGTTSGSVPQGGLIRELVVPDNK